MTNRTGSERTNSSLPERSLKALSNASFVSISLIQIQIFIVRVIGIINSILWKWSSALVQECPGLICSRANLIQNRAFEPTGNPVRFQLQGLPVDDFRQPGVLPISVVA